MSTNMFNRWASQLTPYWFAESENEFKVALGVCVCVFNALFWWLVLLLVGFRFAFSFICCSCAYICLWLYVVYCIMYEMYKCSLSRSLRVCVCAFEDVLYCEMIDHAVVFFSSSFSILFHFTSIEIYVRLFVCAPDCLNEKTYIYVYVCDFF